VFCLKKESGIFRNLTVSSFPKFKFSFTPNFTHKKKQRFNLIKTSKGVSYIKKYKEKRAKIKQFKIFYDTDLETSQKSVANGLS